MSRNTGNPPSFLSFVRKSSLVKDKSSDDDRALLLPSNSSSFNLMDDLEVLNSSRAIHRVNKGKLRKSKQRSQLDSAHSQHASSSTIGSGTSRSSFQAPSSTDGDECDYSNEYGSDECNPKVGGEISLQSIPSKDSLRSIKSIATRSINTIHSGKSYKSHYSSFNDETSPNLSAKPSSKGEKSLTRQMEWKREEKRRDWVTRHKRRRIVGAMSLTVIYSLLFFYTIIVTVGPLALHFWIDPIDWCPYYETPWEVDAHDATSPGGERKNILGDDTIKTWNIDILQRTSNDIHQHNQQRNANGNEDTSENVFKKYDNPDYDDSPCRITRIPSLFYLTLEECDLSRRMAASIIFGGFIGYERRACDRPAGIRTMALVALGSCFFTISSQLAFRDSPMTWDSSRVAAAIPSGVGFLGAGLIWKGSLSDGNGNEVHQVHGITTAASLWLAASVGVGAGGALYAVTAYSTALIIIVLRFGPRLYFQNDRGFEYDDYDTTLQEDGLVEQNAGDLEGKKIAMNEESATLDATNVELSTAGKDYGAIDSRERAETNKVALLSQENLLVHESRVDSDNATKNRVGQSKDNPYLSWFAKLIPGKDSNWPPNPYQEYARDKEVVLMMKKKRSTLKMSRSGPSFCT